MPQRLKGSEEMLSPDEEKKLDESLVALTNLYRDNQIEPNSYYKCLVCLAYEFAIADKGLRAASIAQGIPVDYFKGVLRKQMQEDANFAYLTYTLSLCLLEQGLVHLGSAIPATMPAARA